MGDRGNVFITSTTSDEWKAKEDLQLGIYVYSHWAGYDLPVMVRDALKAGKDRWSDKMYLTRIIIDQVTKSARDEETGFGVGLSIGDNEGSRPITIVNLGERQVAWASPGDEREPAKWFGQMDFAVFVGIDVDKIGYPPNLH